MSFTFFLRSRWKRAKGDTIPKNDTFWDSNEPDITGFNYATRATSPITKEAFQKCTSNPTYGCSVSESFKCNQKPAGSTSLTPSFRVEDAVTGTMCETGKNCKGNVNSLFVSFDLVKATTTDATPACMALLGPNVDDEHIKETEYDQCSLLFDFQRPEGTGAESYDYAKWIDLKCNQRTRALMCTTLGKVLNVKSILRYEISYICKKMNIG